MRSVGSHVWRAHEQLCMEHLRIKDAGQNTDLCMECPLGKPEALTDGIARRQQLKGGVVTQQWVLQLPHVLPSAPPWLRRCGRHAARCRRATA